MLQEPDLSRLVKLPYRWLILCSIYFGFLLLTSVPEYEVVKGLYSSFLRTLLLNHNLTVFNFVLLFLGDLLPLCLSCQTRLSAHFMIIIIVRYEVLNKLN